MLRFVWTIALIGCYQPTIAEGQFSCSAVDARCPSGFTCDPCRWLCVSASHACAVDGGRASDGEVGASRDLAGADLAGADAPTAGFDLSSAGQPDLGPVTTLAFDTDSLPMTTSCIVDLVVTGDFNGDGISDALTSCGTVLGVRGGPPRWAALPSPLPFRYAAVADVDGDGRLDVAGADTEPNVLVGLNQGSSSDGVPLFGWSSFPFMTATQETISQPQLGDFDGDGIVDVLVLTSSSSIPYWRATVLFGVGKGVLSVPPMEYPLGDTTQTLAAADFARLGSTDLLTIDRTAGIPQLNHYHNGGVGTPRSKLFAQEDRFGAGGVQACAGTVVADFDGDGLLDLAMADQRDGKVRLALFSQLAPNATLPAYDAGGCAFALAVGDFNRDGRPDVATLQSCSDTVTVLLNQGGTLGPPHALPLASSTSGGLGGFGAADLDGDGLSEIVVGQTDRLVVLRNTSH